MEGDIAARIITVASIEQDIGSLQEEYDKCLQTRDQNMVTAVTKINESYNVKLDDLKRMLMDLAESRRNELDVEYNKELDKQSELEDEYNRNLEVLESNLLMLARSKQCEIDRLRFKESQISRKRTGLSCYKAIMNYLDNEGKEAC